MKHTIKSLNHQSIKAVNDGIIEFNEIKMKTDSWTDFEFDDRFPHLITFIFRDANGQVFPKEVDLSKLSLTYDFVLDKIRPYFDDGFKLKNN